VFDPARITLGQILKIFFSIAHDPTQLNRQGGDVGTQYRSAVFYANDAQRQIAASYVAQIDAAGVFRRAARHVARAARSLLPSGAVPPRLRGAKPAATLRPRGGGAKVEKLREVHADMLKETA
jgi:peptide-methionine (S)-S-oxide reductase